ncbi:hypothetical protein NP233_g4667 [Leucocoprinus birnbaumii]|uniref:Uncharacterized protein n=1 Tax=Leucocoprinus birnbaumii TaxID=56174 RepID=A0AAD5VUL0_9AGAR|nr:hypothetical protein NP233_g4667 [Leucocoprinus birnbaumii]
MPAPAVYILAVVGTIGAAYAFHQFVYEPHLAPKIEIWAEEFIARRRARRMQQQQQGPIPVPASIPLRRRRRRRSGSRHSDSTLSGSEGSGSDSDHPGPSSRGGGGPKPPSGPLSSSRGTDLDQSVAHEVNEWRSEVGRSQRSSGLRHRTNATHVMDESINPIPHPTMSPTHVVFDTPLQRPSPLSQARKPLPPAHRTPTSPLSPSVTTPVPDTTYSPPSFSSPIPSLSQSYPQELDRERGVELLSPPSSGISSPFTTFSPLVAPQALSPFAVVQPLDRDPSPEGSHPRSLNPASRSSSPSQHTVTDAEYRSLPTSPTWPLSELSSPVHVAGEAVRSPSREEVGQPASINFTSPNALSPRSPHSDLSDLDLESDFDVISEQGSEGSGRSWAGISTGSGLSNGRR